MRRKVATVQLIQLTYEECYRSGQDLDVGAALPMDADHVEMRQALMDALDRIQRERVLGRRETIAAWMRIRKSRQSCRRSAFMHDS